MMAARRCWHAHCSLTRACLCYVHSVDNVMLQGWCKSVSQARHVYLDRSYSWHALMCTLSRVQAREGQGAVIPSASPAVTLLRPAENKVRTSLQPPAAPPALAPRRVRGNGRHVLC